MTPQVLYFDLGNVLLSFSHAQMCRQIADVARMTPEAVREALFETSGPSAVQWQYEAGQISTDDYYNHICSRLGGQPDRPRLEHAACDIFEPIVATWELVRSLAAAAAHGRGPRLAILSNCNLLHWQFITDGRFPLLASPGGATSPFDWAVVSFQVGAMKPDRRIFEAAIDRAGVPPEAVFFVDDRPENVVAARAVGIDAVQYEGTIKLVDDLRRRDVVGY